MIVLAWCPTCSLSALWRRPQTEMASVVKTVVFLLNNESGGSWLGPGDTHKDGETAWVTQINLFIHSANPVTLTLGLSQRQRSSFFFPLTQYINLFGHCQADEVR